MIMRNDSIRSWMIVGVSFTLMFILFATCISCMGVYVKPVIESLGVSRTAFHLTITIGSCAMMLSAIIAGRLMKRFSIKRLMLIGTAICGASMFIYATAPSIYFFYVAAVFMGLSISLTCNIPISVLIKRWFGEKQEGTAIGIAFVGSGAGAMILNPLYAHFIESVGWRYSFGLAGLFMLVILIPLIIFIINDYPETEMKENDDAASAADENGIYLQEAIRKPQTWITFTAYIIVALVNMAILNSGIAFMSDYGYSAAMASKVIAFASAALIFGKIFFGVVSDKMGSKPATVIGASMMILCLVAFWLNGMIQSKGMVVVFIVCYGFGAAVSTVSMPLVISKMFGKADFSSLMGFYSMTAGIGGMLQIIVSVIYDHCHSYYPAWIMLTILSIAMVSSFAFAVRPIRR